MSELSFEKEKQQLLRQKIQRIKKLFPEQINQLIKIGYIFQFMNRQHLHMPATRGKQYKPLTIQNVEILY